jgi:hypothetical protein
MQFIYVSIISIMNAMSTLRLYDIEWTEKMKLKQQKGSEHPISWSCSDVRLEEVLTRSSDFSFAECTL